MLDDRAICKKYWSGYTVDKIVGTIFKRQSAARKERMTKKEVRRIVEQIIVNDLKKL